MLASGAHRIRLCALLQCALLLGLALCYPSASSAQAQSGTVLQRVESLQRQASKLQARGNHRQALITLDQALALAAPNSAQQRRVLVQLGHAYFLAGDVTRAIEILNQALEQSRGTDPATAAAALNNLGNVHAAHGRHQEALVAYRESMNLAARVGATALEVRALINGARVAIDTGARQQAKDWLERAFDQLDAMPPARDKIFDLMAAARTLQRLAGALDKASQQRVYQALNMAAALAEELGDARAGAYALGYLGERYEQQQRYQDALRLTQRAEFLAQQTSAPDILYRWQWQNGRLLAALGELDAAISAYRRAEYNLRSLRQSLVAGRVDEFSFRKTIAPLFFQLADLLLRKAATLDPKAAEPYLQEARSTVERLKTAELQDYFQDECVSAFLARTTGFDRLVPRTAVIYPILLEERTELLISLPNGMRRVPVPIDRETLTAKIRTFRQRLERRIDYRYLEPAQELHTLLIDPIEPLLQAEQIETLVFVPDGPLRTIPMAALYDGDGETYLIERYAIAVTPGLTLTDPQSLRRERMRVLLSGITEPVQGFNALPHVTAEIASVQELYGGKQLQNQDFRLEIFSRELSEIPYTVVHIASHAQFSSDPKQTFLLTYDDKLTMDRLETYLGVGRYRDDPVELLTLSACQTATGDERAALGLAGVAVKAGARSALATLWFVNDQATSDLVVEFYRQLKQPGVSKAAALRQAQLTLIQDRRYRHPSYWAPFLIIGNWL